MSADTSEPVTSQAGIGGTHADRDDGDAMLHGREATPL